MVWQKILKVSMEEANFYGKTFAMPFGRNGHLYFKGVTIASRSRDVFHETHACASYRAWQAHRKAEHAFYARELLQKPKCFQTILLRTLRC